LDIVKDTDASEVVFVLPKQARAFKPEGHFVVLADEAKDSGKSISFLCSDSKVNELAKKYKFDVLSTKTERPRADIDGALSRSLSPSSSSLRPRADLVEDHNETKEEIEYEEEKSEAVDEEPPYGTELDESGDPIYDEKEIEGEETTSKAPFADFQILTASSRRSMDDVIKPSEGKHVKVAQKGKRPIKIETRTEEEDIQSVWGQGTTDNIWADIDKPRTPKQPFFKKRDFNFSFKNFPKIRKRGIVILLIAPFLILGFIVFLTVGSAQIEIKPRSQILDSQLKVTMSPDLSSVDNLLNRIPGQLFTINKSASNEFSATAEKDAVQKSRGIITIFNKYSTSPQPLVATTRFEYIQEGEESGLVFRTLQAVTVPGMKVENGVIVPGRKNVEVIADKAGQAYNVPVGDFGIVAWRERGDTLRYEKIYGQSNNSMHGGIVGRAKVVSEFDYNNARDNLVTQVVNEINEALSTQSAGLELLANIEPEINPVDSTAKIDDAVDTFTMTVNGSMVTMGYKKEDLMGLIASHVEKTSDLMIVPEKLELSYKNAVMDFVKNTFEVIVVIGGNAYAKINKADIVVNLMGKNEFQIKEYLSAIADIDSAKVVLSPFWVKKIPKNKEKIDISLTF